MPATSYLAGTTCYHVVSGSSTNAATIKGAKGVLYGWAIGNTSANARFVKLYNETTIPVPASDAVFLSIEIPGNTNGAGNNFQFDPGILFGTGLGIATTVNVSDTDATPVAAGDLTINLFYV